MMKLRAEKISKTFYREGNRQKFFNAIEETTITLSEGSVTVIKGRSGSGKSTLLNIMGGLLQPDAGQVFLDDNSLYSLTDREMSRLRNRYIGIIPQGHTALRSLTVLENVMLPVHLYTPEQDVYDRAMQLLQRTGMETLADASPAELSGGELRRMAIARSLLQNPPILLADEPTGDLDDENTELVLQLIRQTADEGTAVLLVTHEAAAEAYADAVYTMQAGKLEVSSRL